MRRTALLALLALALISTVAISVAQRWLVLEAILFPRLRDRIAVDAITIEPRAGRTELWQSKFRGLPYLPRTDAYPRDPEGRPLALLAQINFDETPRLGGYPETGILQFFISDRIDGPAVWGLELEALGSPEAQTRQGWFRIRFHRTVTKDPAALVTDFSFLPDFENLPIIKEYGLEFQARREFESDASGSKLGGYAGFTQQDPRENIPPTAEPWLLLLQIDSNDDGGIMWGDAGIANFFIDKTALAQLDFSRVLYNWDN